MVEFQVDHFDQGPQVSSFPPRAWAAVKTRLVSELTAHEARRGQSRQDWGGGV